MRGAPNQELLPLGGQERQKRVHKGHEANLYGPTKEAAKAALKDFKTKWGSNIPMPLKAGKTIGTNSLCSLIFQLK